MIDEFQDTDPLQVEVARLLAGDRPGALVVVGDAKQSIYRFRRAEVRLFRELVGARRPRGAGAVLHLDAELPLAARDPALREPRLRRARSRSRTRRTSRAYEPIAPPPGLERRARRCVALRFPAPPNAERRRPARGRGRRRSPPSSPTSRRGRARSCATRVTGEARPSRAGDVHGPRAAAHAGAPRSRRRSRPPGLRFTVEGGKSFFDRQEVHETLAVLRAIDDPSDRVALVAALRSSFFGVSDRDIVAYALSGGAAVGGVRRRGPAGRARRSARRCALLDELHERAPPRERAGRARAALRRDARPRRPHRHRAAARPQIANLEKVAALAREASALGALTLRGFTRLLEDRIAERARGARPARRRGRATPTRCASCRSTRRRASRRRSWRSSTPTTRLRRPIDTVPLWDEGRIAIGFRGGCQPPGWDALVQARGEEGARRGAAAALRRLHARARPARRPAAAGRRRASAASGRSSSTRLPAATDADVRVVDAGDAPGRRGARPRPRAVGARERRRASDAVAARWEARAARARGARAPSGRTRPSPATRLAPRASAPPRSPRRRQRRRPRLRQPRAPAPRVDPARRRRRGPAGARPRDGRGARALVRPRRDRAPRARRSRRSGRSRCRCSSARARAARVWRELPLWFPEGAHLVEGIVDLVFEEDGQLVVVDYKTDAIADEQAARPGRPPRAAAPALRPRPRPGPRAAGARAARPLHGPRPRACPSRRRGTRQRLPRRAACRVRAMCVDSVARE